jgi:transposase
MTGTAEEEATVTISEAEYATLRDAVANVSKLEHENKRLSDELTVLLNRLFRKKSERLDPNQLRLFLDELQDAQKRVGETPYEAPRRTKKPKRGHGRASFAAHLPRETIEIELPEDARSCPDCGKDLEPFGEEVTERGHIIPAKMLVRRYVRRKYGCPDGHAVRTAELPASVIDKGKYEASVYAHLAVAKYGDHLPLNRLEGIYKRSGFSLARSSMWEMLARTDEVAAQPILKQMRSELVEESTLFADETPTTVRLEDGKGSKKAYIWAYGNGRKVVFDFTMTRERDGPRRFLGNWKGTLITDGYSGYDAVVRENGIVRAGCWAHARRKVKEALETGATDALPLLRAINRLFWIERAAKRRAEARSFDGQQKRELRARRSRVTLVKIAEIVDELGRQSSTLPKSQLGKALGYIENQWKPLSCFLEEPELPIHNNDAERALRHVVVGRKNWLFFGSERGARVGANLFSLVASCKALGIHPERYLEDALVRVDTTPASEVAGLTPWAWAREQGQPSA